MKFPVIIAIFISVPNFQLIIAEFLEKLSNTYRACFIMFVKLSNSDGVLIAVE